MRQALSIGHRYFGYAGKNNHVNPKEIVEIVQWYAQDKRIKISINGRTDFSIQDDQQEKSSGGFKDASQAHRLSILELKTSWQKPMKRKKDGSRSFSYAKLPLLPNKQHLKQLSFYCTAQRPVDAKLIYLTADGSQVFHKGNCADLEPENMKNYYEELVRSAIRRERLLKRYTHINDTEKMKLEMKVKENSNEEIVIPSLPELSPRSDRK